jgi:MFS family permease
MGSIVEGWRYIAGHATIRIALLASSMAQLLGMSFTTLLPVFARDVLEVGPAGQGLLLTAQGLGALCSAFLIATLGDTIPKGKLVILGISVYGVLEVAFSLSIWFPISMMLMLLLGICHIAANALVQTIVQGHSAPEMRGRVMAVWQQTQVITMAGGLMAGAAAAIWSAPLTVALMGIACSASAIAIGVSIPHARAIR